MRQLGLSGYWVDAGHVVRARSRGGGELVDPLVDDEVIDELVTGVRPTPFRSERLNVTAVAPEEEIRERFAASGCGRKEYPALRRSPTAHNAG